MMSSETTSVKFTIGADPELFMTLPTGKFISLAGKLGGTKEKPIQIQGMSPGFMLQEDNVAAEFNIPPAATSDEFSKNIHQMMLYLRLKAKHMGLVLSITPAAFFDEDQLTSEQTRVFGCDADFNAWTGKQNPRPHCADQRLRTAGGHIHVGTDLPTIMCIRAEDLFLGVPSIVHCTDTQRRALYGRAGSYRETSFGHEYRVLSNFWLSSIERTEWVYEQTKRALNFVSGAVALGISEDDFLTTDREAIENAINMRNQKDQNFLDQKYNITRTHSHARNFSDK
jgi:hypothetical protein